MNDIDQEIRRLAKTIHELMSSSGVGWFSWKQVARYQTGSADGADLLSSVAGLPQYRPFFAATQYKVKLTEEGLELARSAENDPASLPETISADKFPYVVVETAELLLHRQKRLRILDRSTNLQPVRTIPKFASKACCFRFP